MAGGFTWGCGAGCCSRGGDVYQMFKRTSDMWLCSFGFEILKGIFKYYFWKKAVCLREHCWWIWSMVTPESWRNYSWVFQRIFKSPSDFYSLHPQLRANLVINFLKKCVSICEKRQRHLFHSVLDNNRRTERILHYSTLYVKCVCSSSLEVFFYLPIWAPLLYPQSLFEEHYINAMIWLFLHRHPLRSEGCAASDWTNFSCFFWSSVQVVLVLYNCNKIVYFYWESQVKCRRLYEVIFIFLCAA